jgi:hypothetical protein
MTPPPLTPDTKQGFANMTPASLGGVQPDETKGKENFAPF